MIVNINLNDILPILEMKGILTYLTCDQEQENGKLGSELSDVPARTSEKDLLNECCRTS